MARSASSFNRPKAHFIPQPKLLVVCEDSKSGKEYIEDASSYFRVTVEVKIVHCGKTDPLGIVNEALRRQAKFDRVFCLIDRDDHLNFDAALVEAKRSPKLCVIASYPCFEFWFRLHFGYTRKPYSSVGVTSAADALIRELRAYPGMEKYAKSENQRIFTLLGPKLDSARKLAPRVLAEALTVSEMNPSTRIHELLDVFESLSKPSSRFPWAAS